MKCDSVSKEQEHNGSVCQQSYILTCVPKDG